MKNKNRFPVNGAGLPLLVIPARNEERTVYGVVYQSLKTIPCHVVVIDDASSDRTADMARKAGAEVISLSEHVGAWGAAQTGMRYAARLGLYPVVTMDADGQHSPKYIPALIEALDEADIAIGSFTKRNSSSRRLAAKFLKALSGVNLSDITSGFRAYGKKAVLCLISDEATLLEYQDIGVLLMLKKKKMFAAEVETAMTTRAEGCSRIFYSWFAVFKYLAYSMVLSAFK